MCLTPRLRRYETIRLQLEAALQLNIDGALVRIDVRACALRCVRACFVSSMRLPDSRAAALAPGTPQEIGKELKEYHDAALNQEII